jgi:hypothetical protein
LTPIKMVGLYIYKGWVGRPPHSPHQNLGTKLEGGDITESAKVFLSFQLALF